MVLGWNQRRPVRSYGLNSYGLDLDQQAGSPYQPTSGSLQRLQSLANTYFREDPPHTGAVKLERGESDPLAYWAFSL